jgi:hypothetical protein
MSEIIKIAHDMLISIAPVVGIIFFFQFAILKKSFPDNKKIFIGIASVWIGLTFFVIGLEQTLFPIGKLMAYELTSKEFISSHIFPWSDYFWIYLFAILIGISTTLAEPSLLAVSIKAEESSGGFIKSWPLRIAVAIGVGLGLLVGVIRIIYGLPILYFFIAGYLIIIFLVYLSPKEIIPLAFDSGGVTTSTVTVPLIAALGIGLSHSIDGRDILIDGFGLIAFASLFPIIAVMGYIQIVKIINKISK